MNRMDWSLLQTFVAVAKHGSLSAASRNEGVTQPTASRHIAQLEEHLGYRLFERSKSGVVLTARGEVLLESADKMSEAVAGFLPNEETVPPQLSGTVRITASFCPRYLPGFTNRNLVWRLRS